MKIPILPAALASLLLGCAATNRSYAPTATYSDSDPREINDEDILKAFVTAPQAKLPARIAWYNLSPDGFADSLATLADPSITGHYRIPKELIEGFSTFSYRTPYRYGYIGAPVSLKSLRLFGARARCDLLILVSTRFEQTQETSSLILANMLVFPYWLLPNVKVGHAFEASLYVFDVRNGYMYREFQRSDRSEDRWLPVARIEAEAAKERERFTREAAEHFRGELRSFLAAASR